MLAVFTCFAIWLLAVIVGDVPVPADFRYLEVQEAYRRGQLLVLPDRVHYLAQIGTSGSPLAIAWPWVPYLDEDILINSHSLHTLLLRGPIEGASVEATVQSGMDALNTIIHASTLEG
uniref:Uncharacterized protein n=1 Tax=Ditylenchus dipsaci TaxID=166011 RepID=A0A915D3W1_9BILA